LLPIEQIDSFICSVVNHSDKECGEVLQSLYVSLLNVLDIECDADDGLEQLQEHVFDISIPRNKREFIACCLLRFECNCGEHLDRTAHVEMYKLFDDVFSETLYKVIGIEKKQQTYEKQSALAGELNSRGGWQRLYDSTNWPAIIGAIVVAQGIVCAVASGFIAPRGERVAPDRLRRDAACASRLSERESLDCCRRHE